MAEVLPVATPTPGPPAPIPTPAPGGPTVLTLPDGQRLDVTGRSMDELRQLKSAYLGAGSVPARAAIVNSFRSAHPTATAMTDVPRPTPLQPPPQTDQPEQNDLSLLKKRLFTQFNPIEGIEGAAKLLFHPKDWAPTVKHIWDLQQETLSKGISDVKAGNVWQGVSRIIFSQGLMQQPLESAIKDIEAHKPMGAVGTVAGTAASFALPAVAGKIVGGVAGAAERGLGAAGTGMYEGALPAAEGMTTADRAAAAAQGLRGGAVAEGVTQGPTGLARLTAASEDLKQAIQSSADTTQGAIPTNAAMSKFNAYRKSLVDANAPQDVLDAVDNAKETFLNPLRSKPGAAVRNMTPGEATREVLSKGSAPPPVKFPEATIQAREAMADGLAEKITADFPELGQKLGTLKAQQDLAGLIEKKVLTPKTGSSLDPTILLGKMKPDMIGGVALKLALSHPEIKSWLAIQLARGSSGTGSMAAATARVGAYTAALGNVMDQKQ